MTAYEQEQLQTLKKIEKRLEGIEKLLNQQLTQIDKKQDRIAKALEPPKTNTEKHNQLTKILAVVHEISKKLK